jgi:Homeodomain-like domain
MSQHLHVHLSDAQRQHLDSLIKKGNAPARVQTRARVLLLCDRGQGEQRTQQQVAKAVLCCTPTVGQVCRRFAGEGLEAALSEKPRPGQAPKITGDIEAQLVTLACSSPPEGCARWTFKLLAEKLVELRLVDSVSEVAVYKRLKKRSEALEGQVLVHRR